MQLNVVFLPRERTRLRRLAITFTRMSCRRWEIHTGSIRIRQEMRRKKAVLAKVFSTTFEFSARVSMTYLSCFW